MKPSRVWPRTATLEPASRGVTAQARNSSSSSRAGGPDRPRPRATRGGPRAAAPPRGAARPPPPGPRPPWRRRRARAPPPRPRQRRPARPGRGPRRRRPGPPGAAARRHRARGAPHLAGPLARRDRDGRPGAGRDSSSLHPVLPDVPRPRRRMTPDPPRVQPAGPGPRPPPDAVPCAAAAGGALGVGDLVRLYDRAYGVGRSLWMYHGRPGRSARWRRFYARFVRPGDLCFDIGAHVGSRTLCWARLGARVVALEPQPDLALVLRVLCWPERGVTVLRQAVAARPGSVVLRVSPRTPTVTTGSSAFIPPARRRAGVAWGAGGGRRRGRGAA